MKFCLFLDIDECANIRCKNGGTCVDKVNGYKCKCAAGYYGDFCETGKYG